jgi:hypothetical protein
MRAEKCMRNLKGNIEGRDRLGRPKHRQEDITLDIKEIMCNSENWVHVAQNRNKW